MAVVRNFAIDWAKGYGVADAKSESPVTTDTMFQAASISKPVTAMAFLKMVQDGKAALDEDVNRYLKSWKVPANEFTRDHPVTARALLSHTSGTGDGFGFPATSPRSPGPRSSKFSTAKSPRMWARFFGKDRRLPRSSIQGAGSSSCSCSSMDLLGKPFDAIMRDSVLVPVGMTGSTDAAIAGRTRTQGRSRHPGGRPSDAPWHVYPEQSAAGLWTTPTDLARFAIELQKALRGDSGRVLSRPLHGRW